jgi:hypothetical protein
MYLVDVPDEPNEIAAAWRRLEDRLDSLRGRRFFGAFNGGMYRAAVQVRDGDDPVGAGFQTSSLPAGAYLRARLRDEPDRLYERIPTSFAALACQAIRDPDRPGIECYRRLDEVDLLLPIVARPDASHV